LAWIPYLVTGGLVFPAAALLNPYGTAMVAATLLAHLGGSAWLVWLPEWVKAAPGNVAPLMIRRDARWIVAGLAAAAFVIGVLGPGVVLG